MRLVPACAALLLATALTGCGADDAEDTSATEAPPSTSTESPKDASPPATTPSETPNADETSAAEPEPPTGGGDLASVQADVETVAVALESYYRGDPYPQTLDEVQGTLDGAGLALSPGNRLGGYVYDPDAVEFKLCVEDDGGAWATYDTAPMTLRESGETGGCPA